MTVIYMKYKQTDELESGDWIRVTHPPSLYVRKGLPKVWRRLTAHSSTPYQTCVANVVRIQNHYGHTYTISYSGRQHLIKTIWLNYERVIWSR